MALAKYTNSVRFYKGELWSTRLIFYREALIVDDDKPAPENL